VERKNVSRKLFPHARLNASTGKARKVQPGTIRKRAFSLGEK